MIYQIKKFFEIGPGSGNLTEFIVKKNPKKLCLLKKIKDFMKY